MMDSEYCIGCDNNFYNGNNSLGVKQCWHLADARLVARYSISTSTPQTRKENFMKVTRPNCYTKKGVAYYDELPAHLRRGQ